MKLKENGVKMQHKVTGARTQGRLRPSERAKKITARAKESSAKARAKAKAKAKVRTAEKDSEKARAKTKDGALQLHHRQVLGKAPTTECVTTAGSGPYWQGLPTARSSESSPIS